MDPLKSPDSPSIELPAAVLMQDVELRYGAVRALRDLSLRVPRGSLCGLVGQNGAGKTTTLRILATDLQANEGRVEVLGQTLPLGAPAVRPRIGFMPDSAGLYEELTLAEYLDTFAAFYGMARAKRRTAVEVAMDLAGVRPLAGRRLTGLSRGERQRVSLARTLIHDPVLLILDEPAEGLDPRARVELRELLLLLHERGKTILLSSHILADLEEVCTHLVLIDRGKTIYQGSRRRLLAGGLQHCTIRIESLDPPGTLVDRLSSHPGVVVDEQGDGVVSVTVPSEPEFAADLLRRLVGDGVRISSFARRTDSLETVYLRLTEPRDPPA